MGHFLEDFNDSAMHSQQKTCPHGVDAMFLTPMESMQMTHLMPDAVPAAAAAPPPPRGGESSMHTCKQGRGAPWEVGADSV